MPIVHYSQTSDTPPTTVAHAPLELSLINRRLDNDNMPRPIHTALTPKTAIRRDCALWPIEGRGNGSIKWANINFEFEPCVRVEILDKD